MRLQYRKWLYHSIFQKRKNDIREAIQPHFEGKTKHTWYTVKLYKSHLKHLEGSNLLSVTWFEEQQVPQEIEDAQALDESDGKAMDCETEEEENGSDIKIW